MLMEAISKHLVQEYCFISKLRFYTDYRDWILIRLIFPRKDDNKRTIITVITDMEVWHFLVLLNIKIWRIRQALAWRYKCYLWP